MLTLVGLVALAAVFAMICVKAQRVFGRAWSAYRRAASGPAIMGSGG